MTEISAAIEIDAPPIRVYELISDVERTGEWSPECVRCRWIGSASAALPGARYRGWSRNGWRWWRTTSTIVTARPGEELCWDVRFVGRPVARWTYRLSERADGGTNLVETVEDRREVWLRRVSPLITGSADRGARNTDTIDFTLERIKQIAETGDNDA